MSIEGGDTVTAHNLGNSSVIRAPRLDLVVMSGALLDACLANDLARAHELAEFAFPDDFARDDEWVAVRRSQVVADPAWEPWSLRAIVLREERRMVGTTTFHGPPGVNDLGTPAAAEVGYTVFPAGASTTGRAATPTARSNNQPMLSTRTARKYLASFARSDTSEV
jgi:hypothetical protein